MARILETNSGIQTFEDLSRHIEKSKSPSSSLKLGLLGALFEQLHENANRKKRRTDAQAPAKRLAATRPGPTIKKAPEAATDEEAEEHSSSEKMLAVLDVAYHTEPDIRSDVVTYVKLMKILKQNSFNKGREVIEHLEKKLKDVYQQSLGLGEDDPKLRELANEIDNISRSMTVAKMLFIERYHPPLHKNQIFEPTAALAQQIKKLPTAHPNFGTLAEYLRDYEEEGGNKDLKGFISFLEKKRNHHAGVPATEFWFPHYDYHLEQEGRLHKLIKFIKEHSATSMKKDKDGWSD
ncbi:MAG: hypothetical protein V1835_01475 [Candidatus Micrarchaeota archaeon]